MERDGRTEHRRITLAAPEMDGADSSSSERASPPDVAPHRPARPRLAEMGAADHPSRLVAEVSALESLLELPLENLSFDDFVREVLMVFFRALPSEAASLLEVNHDEEHLFFRAALGHASAGLGHFQIPFGSGIVGEVMRTGQPIRIEAGAESDSRMLKAVQDSVGFETRNMVAIPLVIRGRFYGVVELLNRVGGAGFTPEDLEFLMRLCRAASLCIETRLVLGFLGIERRVSVDKAA